MALVVVVGVALARRGRHAAAPPATAAQRANAIDALVRCPSCDGISVPDSSASTAVAIRQAVAPRVRAGQSDGQIDAFLVEPVRAGHPPAPPGTGVDGVGVGAPPGGRLVAVGDGAGDGAVAPAPHRSSAPVSDDDRALVQRALARAVRHRGRAASEAVRAP